MSATTASPPRFAPTIWRDEYNLYLQLATDLQVLKFPLTEGGLGKALKLIPTIVNQPGYLSGRQNIADKIMPKQRIARISKVTLRKRELAKATPEMKRSATDIVRRRFRDER